MAVEYEWNLPITDTIGATWSGVISEVLIVNKEVQLYSEALQDKIGWPISKYPAINLNDNLISNYMHISQLQLVIC